MAGELTPRDLRRLAGNGDSEIVEPRRLFRGQELGETPFLRRRLQEMSRLADGMKPSAPPPGDRGIARRRALQAAAVALAAGGMMTSRQAREWVFGSPAQASAAGTSRPDKPRGPRSKRPLTLAPPDLTGATTTLLSDSNPNVTLGAGNHILVAPNAPLLKGFRIQGNGNAANIAMIGGQFKPPIQLNPATMLNLAGTDYALYTSTGFVGATGGTFTIKCMEGTYIPGVPVPVTAPIPWNATPDDIKAAINLALGDPSACFAVVQDPSQPAGVYKHVPGYNPSMGRVTYVLTGLTGTPTIPQRRNVYAANLSGPWLRQWTGVFHIEGVRVDGTTFGDCWAVENPYGTASLQYANMHNSTYYIPFHEDWSHPDGSQFFNGPAKFFAERCDFSSLGGNGLIVQPGKSTSPFKLQAIYDYWMKEVYLRGVDPDVGRSPQILASAFYLDFWEMSADWTVVSDNVWTNKYAQSTGLPIPDGVQPDWAYWTSRNRNTPVIPAGVTIRADPPGGRFCDPDTIGVGYVNTVGYTGDPQPTVTQRTVM
jgi:hypothetical protein